MITLPAIHCSDPIFHAIPPTDSRYIDAISRYCQGLGSRKPIYSPKDTKDGLCICNLTLPGDTSCAVVRIKTNKRHAKSVAARDACAKLIKKGEMDENLAPVMVPSVTPERRNFGNVKLSEARQKELGLSPVPIEMLHVALESNSEDIAFSDLEEALTIRIQNETRREAIMEYFVSSVLAWNVCTGSNPTAYGVKRATDIIRRVIGAAAVHGGVNTVTEITRALGAGVDTALTSINNIRVVHQLNRMVDHDVPIMIRNAQIPRMIDTETAEIMQKVQEALGYQFKDTQLLLEAMTHKNAKTSKSYDRLEFLGDAVLEIAVIECYYRKCPDAPLEDFKNFKCRLLSNNALGSLYASLGLEDAIIVNSSEFKLTLKKEAARANQFKPNRQTGWSSLDLKKTLGDAFEALIGAVFVDGEFSMEPIQEILRQILVPSIDRSGMECPTFATCSVAATRPAATTSSATVLPIGGKRKKMGSAESRKRAKDQ
ncbi:Dicer-like protein 1 [Entomortierella chlamydospora]|uniref:Dicer-like protein 1 n=1 Tax=Entomortierella chlamydospora TaxID=101097 RepID=A0A9P6SVW7_9FUNG|nr:Dicer-like protein 1 [Entomortierella chlamydospora]